MTLSTRIRRALWEDLHPLKQMPAEWEPDPVVVASYSAAEFLSLAGMGRTSMIETLIWLEEHGQTLGCNTVEAGAAYIRRLEERIAFTREWIAKEQAKRY